MTTSQNESEGTPEEEGVRLTWPRVVGLLLILIAVSTAVYLLVGYVAWERGQVLRIEQEESARTAQIERQVGLARENLAQGNYDLALRRLEWVLERDPEQNDARALQRQAEAALQTALTPEIAQAAATPTTESLPTPEATAVGAAEELARLQRMAQRETWPELLSGVLNFQRQYPGYERLQSDALLYEAYLALGLEALQGSAEEVELGLYYLTQANTLGDLPQEALDYRFWAKLYLDGIAYYGVNWAVASSILRELCLSAPFYQGACDKFVTALVNYADQLAFVEDWCPAAERYKEARQYGNASGLAEKISSAEAGCAEATATPPVLTGTLSLPPVETPIDVTPAP